MSFDLKITDTITPEDKQAVESALIAYNLQRFGESGKRDLAIYLRDEKGSVQGGLIGWTARDWLYIQLLFIPEENRRHGLAGRLLTMAEGEARSRGCVGAYIDTMSPDALNAYRKYGYKIIGKHGPMAGGHFIHWLSKVFD